MKKIVWLVWALAAAGGAGEARGAATRVEPRNYYGRIAQRFGAMLPK